MRTVSGHIIRSFTSRQNFFIECRAYEWKETFYQILRWFIFCVFRVFNVSSCTMFTEVFFTSCRYWRSKICLTMHIRSRQPNDKSFSLHGDAEVSQVNTLAFAGFETMSSMTVFCFYACQVQLYESFEMMKHNFSMRATLKWPFFID